MVENNERKSRKVNVKKMDTYRKTAMIVGALFIIATVTAVVSIVFMGTTLKGPDYLTKVSANENNMVIAVIFWLILSGSVMGIGVMMYPVLKKHNEGLALGYAGLRLVETIFICVAALSLLSMITLSKNLAVGSLDASFYQPTGTLLLALFDWSFIIGTLIFLGLGGLALNYLLYQSKLVPRFISVWGLIGATLIFADAGFLAISGQSGFATIPIVLNLPIAVQEMFLAIWLIGKGFNPSAIDSGSAKNR